MSTPDLDPTLQPEQTTPAPTVPVYFLDVPSLAGVTGDVYRHRCTDGFIGPFATEIEARGVGHHFNVDRIVEVFVPVPTRETPPVAEDGAPEDVAPEDGGDASTNGETGPDDAPQGLTASEVDAPEPGEDGGEITPPPAPTDTDESPSDTDDESPSDPPVVTPETATEGVTEDAGEGADETPAETEVLTGHVYNPSATYDEMLAALAGANVDVKARAGSVRPKKATVEALYYETFDAMR